MADLRPGDQSDGPLPMARQITPAERERVIEQLSAAFAHDLVELDEFERRVGLAYQAATAAELRALTEDIGAGAAPAVAMTSMAVAPMERVGAVLSNVERRGAQVIAQRLVVRSFLANVELDLARARLTSAVTEIDVRCVLGNVEIRLPPGVDVENHGGAFIGSFECRDALGPVGPVTRVVRVVGHATLGSVQVTVEESPD